MQFQPNITNSSSLSSCARKLLFLALAASFAPAAQATITVFNVRLRERTGDTVGIGGVGIYAHSEKFATDADGIPYQADLKKADLKMVRAVAYPDRDRIGVAPLSTFDANVSKIKAAGATPLFIQYLRGWNPSVNPNPDLLKADGTKGGTLESNIVYLVKRYRAAPYNITTQYWEIGNEPNNSVDDLISNPRDYTAIFNSIHFALSNAGVRSNVVLCGPAVSSDYGYNDLATAITDQFLLDCKDSADVVTRHIYAESSTEDHLLNNPQWTREAWDHTSGITSHGQFRLEQKMNALGVPTRVKTGITEYNSIGFDHTIAQGLWNLKALHYALYNPRMRLTTGFLFDSYGTQNDGFGFYNSSKVRDYNYWAHYINRRLRAFDVLQRSSSNPKLTVTGTRYAWLNEYYIEVINTDVSASITDTVMLQGPTGLSLNRIFQLSATVNTLETGVAASNDQNLEFTFPPKSVTIFRFAPTGTTSTTTTASGAAS